MNVCLFGGTFDPIHRGHVAIARAARRRFKLDTVHFVPADVPPHKQTRPIAAFEHRYAMVALATAGEKGFVPSLLEAPSRHTQAVAVSYSIDTVRRLKQQSPKNARHFFLLGIDAFLDIATWRQPEELLAEVEVIVASRPGYSLTDAASALPQSLRSQGLRPTRIQTSNGKVRSLVLPGATVHLLDGIYEDVSATQIRKAAQGKQRLTRYVDAAVADYIRKQKLYLSNS